MYFNNTFFVHWHLLSTVYWRMFMTKQKEIISFILLNFNWFFEHKQVIIIFVESKWAQSFFFIMRRQTMWANEIVKAINIIILWLNEWNKQGKTITDELWFQLSDLMWVRRTMLSCKFMIACVFTHKKVRRSNGTTENKL